MSLTRQEWVELWEDTKVMEEKFKILLGKPGYNTHIVKHLIQRTKDKIQSVIGQME